MRITILDFQESREIQCATMKDAKKYISDQYTSGDPQETQWQYFTRYVNDWNLKNSEKYNEWLEVNCHNSPFMIVPTGALYSSNDLFQMVEYLHEQIAFGDFGSESVDFEFATPERQREYDNFTTDKWLHANLKTIEDLEVWDWHDGCSHLEDLERELEVDIESMDDMTPEQETALEKIYSDCEEYQIDDYIYNTGSGYYGAKDIDRQTKRAYIMQINEYAEA